VVLTVAGEVDLQNSGWHETGVADSGQAVETVSDGLTVWGRTASRAPSLASVSYQTIAELGDASEDDESATTSTTSRSSTSGPSTITIVPPTLVSTGPSLIPVWLSTAVDATDAGPDEQGQRILNGTVPAAVMGEIVDGRPPVDATILLTMDAEGIPVRVEITTVPEGPRLHLVFDLSALGDPQTITIPSD
jgi:hypothetical protein